MTEMVQEFTFILSLQNRNMQQEFKFWVRNWIKPTGKRGEMLKGK